MQVIVVQDYEAMSMCAAKLICETITNKKDAVLGLATGSTPVGTYKNLIKMDKTGKIDFSEVTTFNLDEYLGLEGEHEQSYRYFMNDKLFDHINIQKEKTFVPCGVAEDMVKEARAYDEKIQEMGGIDLQILGIGNNGHIAFNEPDELLSMGTHVVKLTEDTIKANSRFFKHIEEVPREAITMGVGQIMKAKKIVLLASGREKAEAVKGILSGKLTTQNPASFLQLHQDVTLIIDEAIDEVLGREGLDTQIA